MTRLLLAAGMALSLAACSTTGGQTSETHYKSNAGFPVRADSQNKKINTKSKVETLAAAPRLGFAGFSGTQIAVGIN
ncbi:hypothetical protein [Phyllobacterium myrsinacearum]|uniref:Putative lipoprotein YmbA n=1 Tax=Phyllobacterium myrsinacearum TaxID=28101 RepID=A0A839EP90_9HYPH|nr:hypothetical protein [Phyllobacterium myrsinacearum]MBA8880048.1 putative lipoprotein YmbA [Phyllobacterium myrsinacearum]